jgi:hypothetical protein
LLPEQVKARINGPKVKNSAAPAGEQARRGPPAACRAHPTWRRKINVAPMGKQHK